MQGSGLWSTLSRWLETFGPRLRRSMATPKGSQLGSRPACICLLWDRSKCITNTMLQNFPGILMMYNGELDVHFLPNISLQCFQPGLSKTGLQRSNFEKKRTSGIYWQPLTTLYCNLIHCLHYLHGPCRWNSQHLGYSMVFIRASASPAVPPNVLVRIRSMAPWIALEPKALRFSQSRVLFSGPLSLSLRPVGISHRYAHYSHS